MEFCVMGRSEVVVEGPMLLWPEESMVEDVFAFCGRLERGGKEGLGR